MTSASDSQGQVQARVLPPVGRRRRTRPRVSDATPDRARISVDSRLPDEVSSV